MKQSGSISTERHARNFWESSVYQISRHKMQYVHFFNKVFIHPPIYEVKVPLIHSNMGGAGEVPQTSRKWNFFSYVQIFKKNLIGHEVMLVLGQFYFIQRGTNKDSLRVVYVYQILHHCIELHSTFNSRIRWKCSFHLILKPLFCHMVMWFSLNFKETR